MTIGKFIKSKIAERGTNQSELASAAGFKNQSNVAMLLKNNAKMKTENLIAMLEALDCELCVRDKQTGEIRTLSIEE